MATTIKNLDRLNKKFKRLPDRTIALIRPALEQAASGIVEMAKRFVPVKSGDLRDSIGWTWGTDIPKGATRLGSVRGNKDPLLTITIFAGNETAFYARWVEFGTVATRAQPYFFPAYRANKKAAKSRVRRAVNKAAKAEAAL